MATADSIAPPPGFIEDDDAVSPPEGFVEDVSPPEGFVLDDEAPAPTQPQSSPAGDFVKRVAASATQATMQIGRGLMYADAKMDVSGLGKLSKAVFGPADPLDLMRKEVVRFVADVQEAAPAELGVDPSREGTIPSKLAQAAGSVLPIVATGPLAPFTAAALMGESQREEAEAAGAGEGKQAAAFAGGAAIGAVTEATMGLPALLRSAKAVATTGKGAVREIGEQFVKGAVRESGQEALEQVGSNVIAKTLYDPERGVLEGVGEAAALGAAVGGPLGGIVQTAATVDAKRAGELQTDIERDIAALGLPPEQPPLAPLTVTEDEISTGPAPVETTQLPPETALEPTTDEAPIQTDSVIAPAPTEPATPAPSSPEPTAPPAPAVETNSLRSEEPVVAPVQPETAAPVTPAKAEAVVEDALETPVAQRTGPVGNKEVKEQLLATLNSELSQLTAESQVTATASEHDPDAYTIHKGDEWYGNAIIEQSGSKFKIKLKSGRGGTEEFPLTAGSKAEAVDLLRAHFTEARTKTPLTIDIPGDGKFTIYGDGKSILEMMRRVRGLSTAKPSGKPEQAPLPSNPYTGGRAQTAGGSKEFQQQAAQILETLGPAEAEAELKRQIAQVKNPSATRKLLSETLSEVQRLSKMSSQSSETDLGAGAATAVGEQPSQAKISPAAKPSKPTEEMTAAEINKELDALDERTDKNISDLIAAGRGNERPSDAKGKTDPLSVEQRYIGNRRQDLRIEIEQRYGPGAPSRLPSGRGFGPRNKTQGALPPIMPGAGQLTPRTPSVPVAPVKAVSQIIRDLAKGIGLPIRFGRLTTNKYAGYFKQVQNLIGAKSANDLPIVSHEIGHKLDAVFDLSSEPTIATELNMLGDPATPGSRSSWTKSKPLSYKRGEGIGEFVRHWLTDPATATRMAPNTERYFQQVMDANPDFGDVMRQARQDIDNWRNAPAEARLDSSISIGENPNGTRYRLSQLTRDMVDDLHMLKLAVNDASKAGTTLRPSENPYVLARLLRGSYGMADTFIRSGVVDFKTKKVALGTSLEDALKPVAGRIDGFRRWIIAKRAQELRTQGRETGLVSADVDYVANKYAGDAAFQKAFDDLKKWSDGLLQYAVDSGYVSEDSATAMRAMNQDYVPFHRVFEIGAGEDPSVPSSGTGGRGLNVGKVGSVKRLTGSQRDIVDPLETLVKNAYVLVTASEKSAINAAIGGLAGRKDMGKWVEEIATPKESVRVVVEKLRTQLEASGADMDAVPEDLILQFFQNSNQAPWGENVIKVTQKGETTFYRLKSDLFDAFHALDLEDSSRIMQILAQPTQWLRSGVTLTPDFALANLMRDAFSSAVINRYGMLPFEGAVRGVAAMIKNPQLVAQWSASGAAQSLEANYFDRKKLSAFMRERITKDLTPAEQALVIVKSPLTALRWLTGTFESATRIGEFQKSFENAIKSGMPEGEARRLAAFESRDRQDFAKGGAKTKIVRQLAAFWNAQMQANVSLFNAFKNRPVRTMLQGMAFVTVPKLIEQAINWDDDDYWDRPQWERDLFFLIPIGKDDNKHTKFLRIPTPFEVGLIFGTVPGRMLQWAKGKGEGLKNLPSTILRGTIPNPIPQSVQVLYANFLSGPQGWDVWRGRPVVPEHTADLPAELQWTEQTSLTARKVGKAIGLSPMKVDNIIAGTTGGLGRQLTHNAIDRAISAATGEKRTAANAAPGMRFFSTPAGISSQAVEDFYAERTRLTAEKARAKATGSTFKEAAKLAKFEAASDRMAAERKAAKAQKDATKKQAHYLKISAEAKAALR